MSIDERRCKFKPALLQQDIRNVTHSKDHEKEDIKEVFFPGNHGDVVKIPKHIISVPLPVQRKPSLHTEPYLDPQPASRELVEALVVGALTFRYFIGRGLVSSR